MTQHRRYTDAEEAGPAGLDVEQIIRRDAVHEACTLALVRGELDVGFFWEDVTALATYIRDGSTP